MENTTDFVPTTTDLATASIMDINLTMPNGTLANYHDPGTSSVRPRIDNGGLSLGHIDRDGLVRTDEFITLPVDVTPAHAVTTQAASDVTETRAGPMGTPLAPNKAISQGLLVSIGIGSFVFILVVISIVLIVKRRRRPAHEKSCEKDTSSAPVGPIDLSHGEGNPYEQLRQDQNAKHINYTKLNTHGTAAIATYESTILPVTDISPSLAPLNPVRMGIMTELQQAISVAASKRHAGLSLITGNPLITHSGIVTGIHNPTYTVGSDEASSRAEPDATPIRPPRPPKFENLPPGGVPTPAPGTYESISGSSVSAMTAHYLEVFSGSQYSPSSDGYVSMHGGSEYGYLSMK